MALSEPVDENVCGVCEEAYRNPRIVSCLHVYCQSCIDKESCDQTKVFHCKICQSSTTLAPEGAVSLPPDYIRVNRQDLTATVSKKPVCTSCKQMDKAVAYCNVCFNFLCVQCNTAHQNINCFHDHEVVLFSDLDESKPVTIHSPIMCTKHPVENPKLFCHTCQNLLCNECTTTHSGDHKVERLSDVEQSQIEEVKKLLKEGRERIRICDDGLEDLQMQYDGSKSCINEMYQSFKACIENHRDAMLKDLEEKHSEIRLSLMENMHKSEGLIEKMEDSCNYTEKLLENGNSLEILSLKKVVCQRLNDLISSSPKPQTSDNLNYTAEMTTKEYMTKIKREFDKEEPPPVTSSSNNKNRMSNSSAIEEVLSQGLSVSISNSLSSSRSGSLSSPEHLPAQELLNGYPYSKTDNLLVQTSSSRPNGLYEDYPATSLPSDMQSAWASLANTTLEQATNRLNNQDISDVFQFSSSNESDEEPTSPLFQNLTALVSLQAANGIGNGNALNGLGGNGALNGLGSGTSLNGLGGGTSLNAIGSSALSGGPIGSGTSMNGPIGSGTSMNGPIGSGTSMNAPIGSGTSMNGTIGSGTSMNGPIGSGSSMNGPIGSGSNLNGPIGSGTSLNGPIGSGSSLNSSIGGTNTLNGLGGGRLNGLRGNAALNGIGNGSLNGVGNSNSALNALANSNTLNSIGNGNNALNGLGEMDILGLVNSFSMADLRNNTSLKGLSGLGTNNAMDGYAGPISPNGFKNPLPIGSLNGRHSSQKDLASLDGFKSRNWATGNDSFHSTLGRMPSMNGPPPLISPSSTSYSNRSLSGDLDWLKSTAKGQPVRDNRFHARNGGVGFIDNKMHVRMTFGRPGSMCGEFDAASGFCLGMDEDIVVADMQNHRIQIFNTDGKFKGQFGRPGKLPGFLHLPRKVAVIKPSGMFVVCDQGDERSRMQLFDRTGKFLHKITLRYVSVVSGLAVTPDGTILVVDSSSPAVYEINQMGEVLQHVKLEGLMKEPSDIAISRTGKQWYICDFKGHCVVVLSSTGQYISSLASDCTRFPIGISVSDAGDILVGDSHGNKFHITMFSKSGSVLAEFECSEMKVSRCSGLHITSKGYIITISKYTQQVIVLNTLFVK